MGKVIVDSFQHLKTINVNILDTRNSLISATIAVDYFAWQLFRGLATSMYYANISQGKFSWVYINVIHFTGYNNVSYLSYIAYSGEVVCLLTCPIHNCSLYP